MFQNPHLSDTYLKREWNARSGVRREEESLGRHFSQAAGALWDQEWIDRTRVDAAPALEIRHVGIDPASSVSETADETGLCLGGRARDGQAYVLEDRSGRHKPDRWGDIALDWMPHGGRCTVETNQGGDQTVEVLRSRATNRGQRVYELGRGEKWPEPEPGVVYVRRQFSRDSKGTRAEGPSVEWQAGRAHIVGELPDLEREMTTYVPGERKSPNRLDAMVFVVSELRGLGVNAEDRDSAGEASAAVRISELLSERSRRGAAPARVEPVPSGWSRPKMGF
jgi:phage terminase large subunit-like protein